ncbi:starter unit:ACP transacylase in aflatoxin biosynthesis domain-containing protein [Trichoderma breve]|uniref:Starter unit:ACP transacylase in aflatoxin biosynthesis domain-containing protein n=1 Tax=Trichoderma breve TaxID=2034170 RepID=A0A9W9BCD0_9HYPO|nr:starter unit:ACP transacylase in aflatoxin biosynthesis domain-containing protein [Trichoderma breve]KAJ4856976.1 starter unit:ACP transacylase in aflatoxin biosynthesis domain-containing protein [Trichoderma breve]
MNENANTPSGTTSPHVEPLDINIDADTIAKFILFSHEFPSGDVKDLLRRLHRYAKLPRYSQLARFLHECASILKQEVQKLPRPLRDQVPSFHDVVTLASHWEKLKASSLCGTWEGAFLCIYEIAMLIGHHEANNIPYSYGTGENISATCLAGISVGLFPAAAVAVSTSLVDLVYYGVESVRMAFAFCVHVGRISQLLEPTDRVPAEVVQVELDRFNGQQEINDIEMRTVPLTKVSISHVDQASVGVTGPPTRLEKLFSQSEMLGSSRHSPLPISGGLCHVSNVYDLDDVRSILEIAKVWERWGSRSVQLPLLSPYTGGPFMASDAYHLIEAICTEALTKPLYFDKLADGVVAQLSHNPGLPMSSCEILHYRTSLISDTIISDITDKLPSVNVQQDDVVDWVMQDEYAFDQPHGIPSSPQNSKLAIVVNGVDTHTIVPPDRFDVEAHFDPTDEMENSIGTKFGNFIANPGHFDAGFFNMSPREAEQTDPMQRLALVTAYEALEMSGFVPNRTPSSHVSRVGTYYGQASDDYREVNASQKIGTYGIPGTERGFGNGRINYFFKFQGPSFNIDTACSSGLAAVHAACSALWAGDADTAIAGGLNVITNPDIYCMLNKGHFLSKTGQCKVWDAAADGYCRGDGVGSVVIKRLDDALADNDNILATIVAGATNHSAESISITQPHAGAQKDNYRQVLDSAGVNPLDVNYVELHGTGTQVGDAVESESVLDFFAPSGRRRNSEQRLNLGAVKCNIGHGEAAAGIASLIKVLLMYQHNTIPRHVGIKTTMNPVVVQHLANRNAGILLENSPWLPKSNGTKRYSVVNSFGAHGGNTTLLLEDAPLPSIQGDNHDSLSEAQACQVVCISAKSKASLRGNISALLRHLDANKETKLKDLSYTTCARRIHHHIRIAASVASTTQLHKFLEAAAENVDAHAKHVSTAKQRAVVFAFSGQGCFYQGAAEKLFQHAPLFRDQVLQLDRAVCRLGFPSVLAVIIGDAANLIDVGHSKDSSMESPLVVQLALVVLQIALAQYWRLLGITPGAVIGHSLGEYAAFVTAGVLSVADALYLVGKRAKLTLAICEPGSHVMLSVRGASTDRIAELCRESEKEHNYEVSCINGVTDVVISGVRADMVAMRDMLQDAGLKCLLLDIPFAFHSAQLEPILDSFEYEAKRVTFKAPMIPVISPLLGRCVSEGDIINETYLRRATREPVNFVTAMDAAKADGIVDDKAVWIDIGPQPVCTSFARNHYEKGSTQTLASLRQGDNMLSTLTGSLATLHCLGLPVAWNEYFASYEKSLRLVHLEPYQWNQKNYWLQYEGTWTLDKAHPGLSKPEKNKDLGPPSFFTSSAQQIIYQEFTESTGRVTILSNLAHPDLVGAANGHKINGRSVVTGSIWADLTLTVGEYLYKRMVPDADKLYMDVRNMEVAEGVLDISNRQTQISLYTANPDGTHKSDKAFATATVVYEDAQTWQSEWQIASHLVVARANSLWKAAAGEDLSTNSRVSRLSQNAVYQLFANVVDYGERYRGMQRVALAEDTQEATADITLDIDHHGTWHTPPHWIDSTGENTGSSRDFFYITPGWNHFRLAEKLEPGPSVSYRNYVRMFPVEGEPGAFAGDIYLLRDEKIVGVCAGLKFKRVPRALMPIMFPSRQTGKNRNHGPIPAHTNKITASHVPEKVKPPVEPIAPTPPPAQQKQKQTDGEQNPQVAACLELIADETGLELEDLAGEAAFAELGVDSLMSLALSGKLRTELGIEVQASIFIECATVQELINWLSK